MDKIPNKGTQTAPTSQLCKWLNGNFCIIDLFVYLMGPHGLK